VRRATLSVPRTRGMNQAIPVFVLESSGVPRTRGDEPA